jgi:hypothetical protein
LNIWKLQKKCLGDFGLISMNIVDTKIFKKAIDSKLDEDSESFIKIALGSTVIDLAALEANNLRYRYMGLITNRGPDR